MVRAVTEELQRAFQSASATTTQGWRKEVEVVFLLSKALILY